jgi:multidrug efflux pump subunit AcrB
MRPCSEALAVANVHACLTRFRPIVMTTMAACQRIGQSVLYVDSI